MEGEQIPAENQFDERLLNDYVTSNWYKTLYSQLRWNQFRAETTSKEEWQTSILDADANNGDHGLINAMLAEVICDLDEEDSATRKMVFNTALLRDLGEVDSGDINYDSKSRIQKLTELAKLGELLESGYFESLTEKDIEDIIDLRMYPPKSADSRYEARVFQHVQRIGWLRTAMIASEAAETLQEEMYGRSDESPSQYYRLHWLTHSVLGNHLPMVIQSADERLSARVFLEQNQRRIDHCFRFLLRDDVQETLENYYNLASDKELDSAKQDRKLISAMQEWKDYQKQVLDPEYALDPERFVTDLEHLKSNVRMLRRQNKSIVLTSGSFDVAHVPHMRYLKAAKDHGAVLIAGVDADDKVRARKQKDDGVPRPIIPENERIEMILHSRYVDYAIIKPMAWRHQAVIKAVKPDVLILSEDTHYKSDRLALEELKTICKEVVILPRMGKRTTSSIIRELLLIGQALGEKKQK